jgi:hypothetical protein
MSKEGPFQGLKRGRMNKWSLGLVAGFGPRRSGFDLRSGMKDFWRAKWHCTGFLRVLRLPHPILIQPTVPHSLVILSRYTIYSYSQ